jgi:hypothetical protein
MADSSPPTGQEIRHKLQQHMGAASDRRRCTALALAALCCLAGSATRATASDGGWRPLQRHAAGTRALLQDAGSGGAIGISNAQTPAHETDIVPTAAPRCCCLLQSRFSSLRSK